MWHISKNRVLYSLHGQIPSFSLAYPWTYFASFSSPFCSHILRNLEVPILVALALAARKKMVQPNPNLLGRNRVFPDSFRRCTRTHPTSPTASQRSKHTNKCCYRQRVSSMAKGTGSVPLTSRGDNIMLITNTYSCSGLVSYVERGCRSHLKSSLLRPDQQFSQRGIAIMARIQVPAFAKQPGELGRYVSRHPQ